MIGCLPTQALAFLAVFVYATHATQAIAFEWKPGFSLSLCFTTCHSVNRIIIIIIISRPNTQTLLICTIFSRSLSRLWAPWTLLRFPSSRIWAAESARSRGMHGKRPISSNVFGGTLNPTVLYSTTPICFILLCLCVFVPRYTVAVVCSLTWLFAVVSCSFVHPVHTTTVLCI